MKDNPTPPNPSQLPARRCLPPPLSIPNKPVACLLSPNPTDHPISPNPGLRPLPHCRCPSPPSPPASSGRGQIRHGCTAASASAPSLSSTTTTPVEEEASAFHRQAVVKASCCSSNLHSTAASPPPSLPAPKTLARGHGHRAGVGVTNHPLVQGLDQFAMIWQRGYKDKLLLVHGSREDAHHEGGRKTTLWWILLPLRPLSPCPSGLRSDSRQ